jgi:hypothetical protein
MEDLQNEIVPQVHVVVNIYVEQQYGDILHDPNDSNFCGFASASTSISYVSSLNTTTYANMFTTIVTNEALWSMLVKQKKNWKPKSCNAIT